MTLTVIIDGAAVVVAVSSTADHLAHLLEQAGIQLDTRCRHRGWCGGCTIHLRDGTLQDRDGHRVTGPTRDLPACLHRPVPDADATIEVPRRSTAGSAARVADTFTLTGLWHRDPLDAAHPYGLAIDVGTTTVVVLLVDLASGEARATASAYNDQIHLGDNVITRIQLCQQDPAQVGVLQRSVLDNTLHRLTAQALRQAGVEAARVGCAVVAGNTTMLHLLAGVDPTPMGMSPFPPVFLDHRLVPLAERLGLPAERPVHLLPGAAAYVGADVCAGMLSSGLLETSAPTLLVDVGTNGEMILAAGGKLSACATAAGPAFEGSGLSSGVRAQPGAVSHLRLHGDPPRADLDLIPGADPLGICGSAYVDFLSQGRTAGLLDATGRFTGVLDAVANAPVAGEGRAWTLRAGEDHLRITESDIAALLQGKAAIASGAVTLLERRGLTPMDIDRVLLAGGFGLHIDPASAVGSGLLPGFDPARIIPVGNSALGGAYLALMDRGSFQRIETAVAAMEIVELNLDPGFEMCYIENLML